MSLKVRAVRIRVVTDSGSFGRLVPFAPGFNVLRGANSRGKTQVVQAIIYALGMERMLQARSNAPLGSAVTSEIRLSSDDESAAVPVRSSWVAAEIENELGRVVTVQRFVKHSRMQQNLVRVWEGPALTEREREFDSRDLFLHQSGSVSRDLGFHHLLTEMLGWELPTVSTYAANPTILYPDVIFPFLLVDQQSWGSAAPRKVDRYQIREPLRRAVEFLLGLQGPAEEERRDTLERQLLDLRARWSAERSALEALASAVGGRIAGVPEQPSGAQARKGTPAVTDLESASLELLVRGEWFPASRVLLDLGSELEVLTSQTTPRHGEALGDSERDLAEAKGELADVLAAAQLIDQDLSTSEAQLVALDRRLQSLTEERDRNSDVRTLIRLGSVDAGLHAADENCPTCRQSLVPVEAAELGPVLDVEETIALLNAQVATTQRMRVRTQATANESSSAYAALQRQADQLRARIRAIEADLVAPEGSPSEGDIARKITVQLRIDDLSRTSTAVDERLQSLSEIAREVVAARIELNALPGGVPDADKQRLSLLTDLMRERLSLTRFDSYAVSDVALDQDSLRPSRAGFDVDIDVSASDVVRIKTAYLDALRVLGQESGRHPGLLVLDEPRQQDLQAEDFAAMLRYLSLSEQDGGQVIVTSATPLADLEQLLGTPVQHSVDLGEYRLLTLEDDEDPLGSISE